MKACAKSVPQLFSVLIIPVLKSTSEDGTSSPSLANTIGSYMYDSVFFSSLAVKETVAVSIVSSRLIIFSLNFIIEEISSPASSLCNS